MSFLPTIALILSVDVLRKFTVKSCQMELVSKSSSVMIAEMKPQKKELLKITPKHLGCKVLKKVLLPTGIMQQNRPRVNG